MSGADERFMALALALAARGLGQVWPNPAVGCVIVRQGRIVGRGRTAPGGRPHAETQALAEAGVLARGATAYVSLEPCAHHGKTPPCAGALIEAGIARVVSATPDSDVRVAGRGHRMLRAAGLALRTGVMEAEARALNAGFFLRVEQGRPLVTLKLATTFDGRVATARGESRWITGAEARRAVHAMRARHDAVMVGGGTARADDPALTVRGLGVERQPVRVVLSRGPDLPLDGRLARTAGEVPVWVLHASGADCARVAAWRGLGARTVSVTGQGGGLDPQAALSALGGLGLTRVFCEGGGAVAASLIRAGLVDELIGLSAGCVIGAEGVPAIGAMGGGGLSDAPRFVLKESRRVGPDILHRWVREDPCRAAQPV